MNAAIIGIDTRANESLYRVISFRMDSDGWKFARQIANASQLTSAINASKTNCINAKVEGNSLKGNPAALSRFENGVNKPMVILTEIVAKSSSGDEVLGYKMSNYDGVVKNITLREVLAYCERITKAGGVPIQNAMYVAETADQKAHIRCYAGAEFLKESIIRKRTQQAQPAQIQKGANEKALNKLEELFTKEQIEQLKIGKRNGVNIRIYGNNNLSADQMQIIREALEERLDAGLFADPRYSVDSMRYLRADLKYGVDISYFMNPKYSLEQLSELDSGYLSGIDISKYSDPSLTPEQMSEIRLRLENNFWKEHEVSKDESWK